MLIATNGAKSLNYNRTPLKATLYNGHIHSYFNISKTAVTHVSTTVTATNIGPDFQNDVSTTAS